MSWEEAKARLSLSVFPIQEMRRIDTEELGDPVKKRIRGIDTRQTRHEDNMANKHDCLEITYCTKFDDYQVKYFYVFCGQCERAVRQDAIIFNNDTCSAYKVRMLV